MGRQAILCPDPDKLLEMAEAGKLPTHIATHFGKATRTINRWLAERGLDPRGVIPDLPGEEWLPVVGWEGQYEVSNMGRVKSVDRIGHGGQRIRARLKRPAFMSGRNSYWQVHLFRGPRDTPPLRVNVHRLVLEAFVGTCPDGMEAIHINGNGFDNRLENLRWDTHEANMALESKYEKFVGVCPTCGRPSADE